MNHGRSVVVTGGGGAIGSACVRSLCQSGAKVSVVDIDFNRAKVLANEMVAAGFEAVPFQCNVASFDEAQRLIDDVYDRFGYIDGLVNNAGIMPHQDVSFATATMDDWREILDINLGGTVNLSRCALPHLKESVRRRALPSSIVNMSSFLVLLGARIPQDGYTASKGAIASLSRSMAVELGEDQIRVNTVAPGPIETPHVAKFFNTAEARAKRIERFPLGRFGRPEDVSEAISFLISDKSAWITGVLLPIDGGASCNYI
ncbi:MAG: SDR family NAD(P)-dependent oxidoreductase [Actinomycetota bacterium]|nr:SDR family NAD(P)-dependent oxidoreductase [Actinomycetota bacterium]